MPIYAYQKPTANATVLHPVLIASGLPYDYMTGPDPAGNIQITMWADLTPEQKAQLDTIIATHDPIPRRKRPLLDIFNAVNGLSTAQKNAVWTDITGGSPPKWALNAGPNSAAMASMHFLTGVSNFTVTQRVGFVTMYAQDNPKYLTTAPLNFGVAGDEPTS